MRSFRSLSRIAVALIVAAPLGACQDHHWVEFDKMGEVKMAERPAEAPPEPITTEGRPGVPYDGAGMLSGNGPSAPASMPGGGESGDFSGVIAAGIVDVDPADKAKALPSMTLYVIARPVTGGPPVAALRATDVIFPYSFRLTEEDVMMAPPQAGQPLTIEARFDFDGDPMSKDAEKDLFALSPGEIIVGDEKVALTLKTASGD